MEVNGADGAALDPLTAAHRYFRSHGTAHLVGGRVRDWLLHRMTVDTDITVPADAVEHARAIADATGGHFVLLDEARDVGRVVWPAARGQTPVLDIARWTGPSLEADLAARDFTVDALALPLTRRALVRRNILDPTGGLADLEARRIRMTSPVALDADPLRLLRAVRLAAELGFEIERATRDAVRARASLVTASAHERVRHELLRLLAADGAADHVAQLDRLGLLEPLVPELSALHGVRQSPPHTEDVWGHTLSVLSALEALQRYVFGGPWDAALPLEWRDMLASRRLTLDAHLRSALSDGASRGVMLRLAALLHDVGKPATAAADPDDTTRIRFIGHETAGAETSGVVVRRLRFGSSAVGYLTTVVRHHLRPLHLATEDRVTRRAVYRYFRDTGAIGIDIALLALADNAAKHGVTDGRQVALGSLVGQLLDAWFERREQQVRPPRLVDGRALMEALELAPGPEVGRLLAEIEEAQAAGEVTTVDEALDLARRARAQRPSPATD